MPTAGNVEKGGTGSPCGKDGHEEDYGECSKEAFQTNSIQGSDGILFHDLFLDDELSCGTNNQGHKGENESERSGKDDTDKS